MKRVACLYRVSTKRQVGVEGDIPLQQKACIEFIKEHHDWEYSDEREYYERGVSGFHKSVKEREVLEQLLDDAKERKFDILLVFMLDRLGRREDEIPVVVATLINLKVEVWSVKEGRQVLENHTDKLMMYLKYWQASGESIKTGIRVGEKHKQLVLDGELVVNPPYGYKTIMTGEINNKGRAIKKNIIIPEEAEVIKLMFDLCIKHGYGGLRIANELNARGIKTRNDSKWQSVTINHQLRNPIYKGYIAIGKTMKKGKKGRRPAEDWIVSNVKNEELAIIPEEVWEKAQQVRMARTPKKYRPENMNYEQPSVPTKSNLLFSGFSYCGYCGSKLSTGCTYDRWTTKNGEKKKALRNFYKCVTRTTAGKSKCSGKCHYKKEYVEEIVLEQVYNYLDGLKVSNYQDVIMEEIENQKKSEQEKLKKISSQIERSKKAITMINDEIVKSMLGESQLTTEHWKAILKQEEEKIQQFESEMSMQENIANQSNVSREQVKKLATTIPVWRDVFEKSDITVKKAMLAELIERVDVSSEKISVTMRLSLEDFMYNFTQKSGWDVDSLDWKDYGVESIIKTVCEHRHLGNGSIILMHNGAKYTAEALPKVIEGLQARGYTIVPVSQLIAEGEYTIDHEGRQHKKQ